MSIAELSSDVAVIVKIATMDFEQGCGKAVVGRRVGRVTNLVRRLRAPNISLRCQMEEILARVAV